MIKSMTAAVFLGLAACNIYAGEQNQADYLGQEPPGDQPVPFAPGWISTPDHNELNAIFTKDWTEFYFARDINGFYRIYVVKQSDDGWGEPELMPFTNPDDDIHDVDMAFTADEQTMYFLSQRPSTLSEEPLNNIWVTRRTNFGWSEPVIVPPPVSSPGVEFFPWPVNDGSLYLASTREGGKGHRDLYYLPLTQSGFTRAVNITELNTEHSESDVYVSPDDRIMIFVSNRPGGQGRADMYVSFKGEDGFWGEAMNLGAPINSAEHDYAPSFSPDGKYFFFTRHNDIYWVSSSFLEEFKP